MKMVVPTIKCDDNGELILDMKGAHLTLEPIKDATVDSLLQMTEDERTRTVNAMSLDSLQDLSTRIDQEIEDARLFTANSLAIFDSLVTIEDELKQTMTLVKQMTKIIEAQDAQLQEQISVMAQVMRKRSKHK